MKIDPVALQIIKKGSLDVNGNSRYLILVYSQAGHVVEIRQTDYGNIPADLKGLMRLPDMKLTNRDFNEWDDLRENWY